MTMKRLEAWSLVLLCGGLCVSQTALARRTKTRRPVTAKKVEAKPAPNTTSTQETKTELLPDEKSMCQQLMAWGKKYEASNQLYHALRCYKAAAIVDPAVAEEAIKNLEKQIKEIENQRRQNEVIQSLMLEADKGNATAAFKLGELYFDQGIVEEAVKMWTRASDLKHPEAAYKLALMYEHGDQVSVNLSKARQFYRQGAQNGQRECLYMTAKLMEEEAQNTPQTASQKLKEARQMKEKAANLGHALAAAEMGFDYASSENYSKASFYFEKAFQNAQDLETITLSLRGCMEFCKKAVDKLSHPF